MLDFSQYLNSHEAEEKQTLEIGDRLMIARKACYLTRQELSQRCGISEHTIQSWEVGRRVPKPKNLYTIINVFKECGYHTSLSWILNNSLPEEKPEKKHLVHLSDLTRYLIYNENLINAAFNSAKQKAAQEKNYNLENFLEQLTKSYFKLFQREG